MTSRLNVRKVAGAIARRMGAPVEPCVYMATGSTTTRNVRITLPVERGPFVAFDGFSNSSAVQDEAIQAFSAQRPIIYPRPRSGNQVAALDGVPSWVFFPDARVISNNLVNLDGWPAPVYIGAGDVFSIQRAETTPLPQVLFAISGFHTTREAQLEIASVMGETRAFILQRPQFNLTIGRDEMSLPESVVLHYAYRALSPGDLVYQQVYLATKALVNQSILNPCGLPDCSSPGTVIGPRPMQIDDLVSTQWPAVDEDYQNAFAFVGVAHDVHL